MSLFCRLSFVLPLQLGPGPQLVADVQFPGHTEGPRWNSPWMQPAYVSDEDILPARQQSPAPLEVCFVSVLLFTQRWCVLCLFCRLHAKHLVKVVAEDPVTFCLVMHPLYKAPEQPSWTPPSPPEKPRKVQ